jgi:predicted transcriptional regulator
MKVLLSVKPKYVEKIMSGDKRYEFRKTIWKKKINEVYIYSTTPEKKIVASFTYDKVIKEDPQTLWEFYHEESGLTQGEFFDYFRGIKKGYAIPIKELKPFDPPLELSLNNIRPPQSFRYISEEQVSHLI